MNLALGEFHRFRGNRETFLYMVNSGGIVALDEVSDVLVQKLEGRTLSGDDLIRETVADGYAAQEVVESLRELWQLGAVSDGAPKPVISQALPDDFPLQSIVLNITNQCNLSCSYCYEFGEDKIATPDGKPKFMDWHTAKASVDYLFESASSRDALHITFFGGETLMNFPLLQKVVDYARGLAKEKNVRIGFSLTTNATLLTTKIIEYLADNEIGVTVSIDGTKEMQDKFRIFSNGKGSYDVIKPKIKELIARHRSRPIAARVTLTSGASDVLKIYDHLKNEFNFHEVAFAPVTTSPNRLYSIGEPGMDKVLEQFSELAKDYLQSALRGEHHGFSNVSDTLAELHQGVNKSLPCGAGLGMVGVGPSGDIAPCHRFVDSDDHVIGHIDTGIDMEKRGEFLKKGRIDGKYDCHSCWARPLCAGGCHHEAFVRYGDSGHANLHYCDWIREWTHTCLSVYGAIAEENPAFLEHFSERKAS
ncbi:quinohemoprotein amine dehydrogenase maturation protein [Terriglobus albidus]|uniref:Quinohemoprotein amine dehydrogenase maturation protein n=1 Tax=Terriglobus albidus TaxID=1592106 RepID=A0A5B9E857_9BACT|nr:quinohemoprotein amine dehydrogenase maturation protein [Terriglobus albidus]QEE28412.1 quinohemoprotein amine dehydrogenase maturation protein [Terriglobus albidus]